jgi:hypothetical protein
MCERLRRLRLSDRIIRLHLQFYILLKKATQLKTLLEKKQKKAEASTSENLEGGKKSTSECQTWEQILKYSQLFLRF